MPTPRTLPVLLVTIMLGAGALAGCGSSGSSSTAGSSGSSTATSPTSSSTTSSSQSQPAASAGSTGFEGVPIEQGPLLAPASTTGTGVVDGIKCGPSEQLVYHIHAHLQVYVNGSPRTLPGGIGIPGSQVEQTTEGPVALGGHCIYWLHTHAPDGILHVESPTKRIYTLGNFFDEWHQPLSRNQVASASGPVSAFVNGKPWRGDPRSIPLLPHAVIQLDVGQPIIPFRSMSWKGLSL